MAWSIVGSATGTNTCTPPAHQVGDVFVMYSCRDGSNTAPTLPAAARWVNKSSGGANSLSSRVAWKVCESTSETADTWTNATSVILVVIRNGSIQTGATAAVNNGTNGTFNYAALTPNITDGTSGLLGFVCSVDGTSTAAVATPPSGMTNQTSVLDATDAAGAHYDLSATSWAATNVTAGVTGAWRTTVIEVVDETPAANVVGYTTLGSTSGVSPNYIATKFTPSVTGTINAIKVAMRHPGGAGDSMSVAAYSDASASADSLLFHATTTYTSVDIGTHIVKFTAFTNDAGSPVVTSGTPIWLTVWDNSVGNIVYFSDAGAANQTEQDVAGASTFDTWPATFSATVNNLSDQLTIWAEVTPSASNTTNFFF